MSWSVLWNSSVEGTCSNDNNSSLWKMTLVKVKVTIEGHKGQILDQNSDLTYFQHMALWEIMVNDIESDCTS